MSYLIRFFMLSPHALCKYRLTIVMLDFVVKFNLRYIRAHRDFFLNTCLIFYSPHEIESYAHVYISNFFFLQYSLPAVGYKPARHC